MNNISKISIIALCVLAMSYGSAKAQEIRLGPLHSMDNPRTEWLLPGDTIYQDNQPMIYKGKPSPLRESKTATAESFNNPISDLTYGWGLHKGLNFSVDLSAFATFGKYAPHRGGFTQAINATYLTPVSKDNKLWMALGGYITNTNYGGDSFRDGGFYGILGYKINEHWEAYVYGQISVANNYNSLYGNYGCHGPYGCMYPSYWGAFGRGIMPGNYGYGMPGAKVFGGGVRYTNKNFSIGINVEGAWYNNNTPIYHKQYEYPVPPTTPR